MVTEVIERRVREATREVIQECGGRRGRVYSADNPRSNLELPNQGACRRVSEKGIWKQIATPPPLSF